MRINILWRDLIYCFTEFISFIVILNALLLAFAAANLHIKCKILF